MAFVVTSAGGANGNGYGTLLAFGADGSALGTFANDQRITDPRGLAVDRKQELLFLNSGANRVLAIDAAGQVVRDTGAIDGLNPGGGNFGPDGRYYAGSRSARTIMAFSATLDAPVELVLPIRVVPFPRGFAFGHDGSLFLASGIGTDGNGDNTILLFEPGEFSRPRRLVDDPDLSPLDLAIAPNGNIVVSCEQPFGVPDAVTSVREYDPMSGHLIRVFSPSGVAELRKPRGLRFDGTGNLYCTARDEIVAFDFASGRCIGTPVRFPRLHGQALAFFPI